MPNWCYNVAYIGHEDKSKLEQIENNLKENSDVLFEQLVPNPSGEWQYDWCVENWGTKWDASVFEYEMNDEGRLYLRFDTAWSPPTSFYQAIEKMGFTVEAYYQEEGMGFAGVYEDGEDDFYNYVDMSSDEIKETLPERLDEMFSISMMQKEWEENEDSTSE